MKFAYEDLSDDKFEDLIVLLCQELFGISVQGFAKGPDGGRDGKFVGIAERFPSKAAPWSGTTIIQAKHTNGFNRSFSESDFYSKKSNNTVIGKEIPRIKKLREEKNLDHYILFANRGLSAITEETIRKHIESTCGVPYQSIELCGLQRLESWMKNFPDVAKKANIDPIDSPLIVSPDELAEVVEALAHHKKDINEAFNKPPTPRVPYEAKNKANNMSDEYAKTLRTRYLKETSMIKSFLADPLNLDILRMYESVVEEFQLNIIAKRKEYNTFDEVMNYLRHLLFGRDPVLNNNKRLTSAMLFYMYWNCDIGSEDGVAAN